MEIKEVIVNMKAQSQKPSECSGSQAKLETHTVMHQVEELQHAIQASLTNVELRRDALDSDIEDLSFIQCLSEECKELAVARVEKEVKHPVPGINAQDVRKEVF